MIFVDLLSFSLFLQLLPLLILRKTFGRRIHLRYFDCTEAGKSWAALLGFKSSRVEYAIDDIWDPSGMKMARRVNEFDTHEEALKLYSAVLADNPLIRDFTALYGNTRAELYLKKIISGEINLLLTRLNVIPWLLQKEASSEPADFFTEGSPWLEYLVPYAAQRGIRLARRRSLNVNFAPLIKIARRLLRMPSLNFKRLSPGKISCSSKKETISTVAFMHQGHGAGFDKDKKSDFFWVDTSGLEKNQLLTLFSRGDINLNGEMISELKKRGIRGLALTEAARGDTRAPFWNPNSLKLSLKAAHRAGRWACSSVFQVIAAPLLASWIIRHGFLYIYRFLYWKNLFETFNIRLYVDYGFHSADRLPAYQAIEELGGLSVGLQHSVHLTHNVVRALATDVYISFGAVRGELEKKSGSCVRDYVIAGYSGASAAPHTKKRAKELRVKLESKGARFVVCFFDENSSSDNRYLHSHSYAAEFYRFLIKRLMEDSSLGLIFKPKHPATLRQRLGPVEAELNGALKTGRCHIFEERSGVSAIYPSEASQASDITIGLLSGITACLEGVLAGTPAFLLDVDGNMFQPWYHQEKGNLIFTSWSELWEAMKEFRLNPASREKLGNWNQILSSLEPFQDGLADQRVGSYIGSLARALSVVSRDAALAKAREEYEARWVRAGKSECLL